MNLSINNEVGRSLTWPYDLEEDVAKGFVKDLAKQQSLSQKPIKTVYPSIYALDLAIIQRIQEVVD
jgi:hypothetical protein